MQENSRSTKRIHAHSTRKPTAKEAMSGLGARVGSVVDKIAEVPGYVAHSAVALATETRTKAARAAKDVATRLDPDQSQKDGPSDKGSHELSK